MSNQQGSTSKVKLIVVSVLLAAIAVMSLINSTIAGNPRTTATNADGHENNTTAQNAQPDVITKQPIADRMQEGGHAFLPTRESITFIMGHDREADNPYYAQAYNYYRYNPTASTDYIDTTCRSLWAVRNKLDSLHNRQGQAWGRINIVVHSNEWNDMGVAVLPGGKRATVNTITAAIDSGDFQPLDDRIIDSETELIVQGCGLGRNEAVLTAVSKAFGGDDIQQPIVRSSRYFIYYETVTEDSQHLQFEKYLAEYWYAFYRTGYRPADYKLNKQLKERYPDASIDWKAALTREQPRFAGDAYYYTFDIPVVWYELYPDKESRPDLGTEEQKMAWLESQPELLAAIEKVGIAKDQFTWTIYKTHYQFEDGTTEPAVKAIGLCTILTVLKTMTVPNPDNPEETLPFQPELTDSRYYATVGADGGE